MVMSNSRDQVRIKTSKSLSPLSKQAVFTTSSAVPVFRYIAKSRWKDAEAPFSECITLKSMIKPISKVNETVGICSKVKAWF